MTEEKGLFKKDKRAAAYRKIVLIAKKMNLIFLYFCIVMNFLVIVMILIGDLNIGVIFFALNTWFLIFLRLKLKKDQINV